MAATEFSKASLEWRSALIDVSGNNRLLHFKPTSSTLSISAEGNLGLNRLLSGQSVSYRDIFAGSVEEERVRKAITKLRAKQKEATEEYGVSVTYLALGFVAWNPNGNRLVNEEQAELTNATELPKSGNGVRPKAPVLLYPVELTQSRGANADSQIKLAEDCQANGVLLHVLNKDRQRLSEDSILNFADAITNAPDIDASITVLASLLSEIKGQCGDIAGFETSLDFVIGTFTYQKQPMVNDVSDLEAIASSDLVAALAGDLEAASRVRSKANNVDVRESTPDYAPVDSEYLVLDADASQSYVVNAAIAGRNLVVQGPPGTGKSQTIANTIASLAAHGKSVLFVAQKRAAITAVLNRLENSDLSHLVLDLFAAAGTRRHVADQLRITFDRQQTVGMPDVQQVIAELTSSRDRLVRHKDALFRPEHGWGESIFSLRVASLGFVADEQVSFRLSPAVFSAWDRSTLPKLGETIRELEALGAVETSWYLTPGWNPKSVTNVGAAERMRQEAHRLRWEILPTLIEGLGSLAQLCGMPKADGLSEAINVSRMHLDVSEVSRVSADLLSGIDLEAMLASVSKTYRKSIPKLPRKRLRYGKKQVSKFMGSLSVDQSVDVLVKAQAVTRIWPAERKIAAHPEAGMVASLANAAMNIALNLEHVTQGYALSQLSFGDLEDVLDGLLSDSRLNFVIRAHELESLLYERGVGQVVEFLRSRRREGKNLETSADRILRWVCVRSVLEPAEMSSPDIAGTRGAELNSASVKFRDADVRHLEKNADRVRRKAAIFLKDAFDKYPEQYGLLKSEVSRKRNFRPVRKLLADAEDVLLAAKPVWAMSPLQVSQSLPAAQCFDVVIFDEASQVKPADAIPALMRGKQVIVAGDSRQLPPTEFFSKVLEDDEETDETSSLNQNGDRLAMEAPKKGISYTRDAESILFAVDNLLAGQSRSLQWHYRSRDERLIAVSNRHVYDGSLTTFPSANTLDSIRHEVVPYSPGIDGGTNSPILEVQHVVALLKEQLAERPEESVGVITFGVKHQHRIEKAIDEACREDAEFERAFSANSDEPCFVKSIERVQGDERDAIILSLGYGKGEDGRLRYMWGPLLKEGGERRLNVAISRAKKRMTLVTSFSRDDVPADGHSSQGFKLMYHFVRFMAAGKHDTESRSDGVHALNAFEIDIKKRLEAAGLELDSQVGVGRYRIDFAVRHPDFPGRHVLAIEADGAAYHSGHTARERDRLRQTLLESRGWRFHRIWSTDWFNNAENEVKRTLEAFHDARRIDELEVRKEGRNAPVAPGIDSLEAPRKRLPRPDFFPGLKIADYQLETLVSLFQYVRSDDILRPKEEEQRLVMEELGLSRRGARIQETLERAQDLA